MWNIHFEILELDKFVVRWIRDKFKTVSNFFD